jgi:hypothetical protein
MGKRTGRPRGRPKGSKNKATKAQEELVRRCLKAGTTPLEVLLEAMEEAYEIGGPLAAAQYAKDAAVYMHSRKIDATLDGQLAHYKAQPIPVERRHSDALAGAAGPTANGHPARSR